MNQDTDANMALAALRAAAKELGETLPEALIASAYAIQRRHQFDRQEHRASSMQDMQRLVDEFIEAEGRPK